MLMCLNQLMHGSFLTIQTQQKLTKLIKTKLTNLGKSGNDLTELDVTVKTCVLSRVDILISKIDGQVERDESKAIAGADQGKQVE